MAATVAAAGLHLVSPPCTAATTPTGTPPPLPPPKPPPTAFEAAAATTIGSQPRTPQQPRKGRAAATRMRTPPSARRHKMNANNGQVRMKKAHEKALQPIIGQEKQPVQEGHRLQQGSHQSPTDAQKQPLRRPLPPPCRAPSSCLRRMPAPQAKGGRRRTATVAGRERRAGAGAGSPGQRKPPSAAEPAAVAQRRWRQPAAAAASWRRWP